jgi:hypothetical protein
MDETTKRMRREESGPGSSPGSPTHAAKRCLYFESQNMLRDMALILQVGEMTLWGRDLFIIT